MSSNSTQWLRSVGYPVLGLVREESLKVIHHLVYHLRCWVRFPVLGLVREESLKVIHHLVHHLTQRWVCCLILDRVRDA